jgi:hypothetical protein
MACPRAPPPAGHHSARGCVDSGTLGLTPLGCLPRHDVPESDPCEPPCPSQVPPSPPRCTSRRSSSSRHLSRCVADARTHFFSPSHRRSASSHLSRSPPMTRAIDHPPPSTPVRRRSTLAHSHGRCYAFESATAGRAAASCSSRSTATLRVRRVPSRGLAAAGHAVGGPAAAVRPAVRAGRGAGMLGRALRPPDSAWRVTYKRCCTLRAFACGAGTGSWARALVCLSVGVPCPSGPLSLRGPAGPLARCVGSF